MKRLTVIDMFCGAGGFSEGFRQCGFKIQMGVDCWEPAINTFNHNFGLQCYAKNVNIFQNGIEEIEKLPDTDIIIGSPPCVTFSSSNISGKADKSSGVTLTQLFLKVIAVKKWKPGSKLKAWFMENVPSSIKYLGNEYTFEELGLGDWATLNKIGRSKVAIKLSGNQAIINSADYGSPQSRERVITGEICKRKKLIIPPVSHSKNVHASSSLMTWRSLKEIKKILPNPFCSSSSRKIFDPNYPEIELPLNKLSDHFYDTGLYASEWKQSRFLKTNHPYMGRMSFPENDNNPSRTITATKIGTSREALIYESEVLRVGDGQFRTHTIREAACLMGFPVTYQFLGGEGAKWRLVGNAVCPSVGRALANQINFELGWNTETKLILELEPDLKNVTDLNNFSLKNFKNPPRKNQGSRFRRHPFKDGNITVTLSNYDIIAKNTNVRRWETSIQYGNGNGFPTFSIQDGYFKKIESIIRSSIKGDNFLKVINNGFSDKIGSAIELQEMYEVQRSKKPYLEPTALVEKVADIIESLDISNEIFEQDKKIIFKNKDSVPLKQLFALYAINKVASTANMK